MTPKYHHIKPHKKCGFLFKQEGKNNMTKKHETLETLLLITLLGLLPIGLFFYVLFNGYPNEHISFLIGIICLICGLKVAIEGIKK